MKGPMLKALDALEALYKAEGPDSPVFLQSEIAYQTAAAVISHLELLREAIHDVRKGVGEIEVKMEEVLSAQGT